MRSPAIVIASLAAALLTPAVATAATNGSVAGTTKLPKGAEASVVATSLVDGSLVSATPVSAKGAFKVSLPAGAYVLATTVVPKPGGGAVATNRLPVSLKKGQKRTKIKVTTKKVKPKKGTAKGTRAYAQERGQVTPGVTAVQIEEFTGGTGEWEYMGKGLAALLTTDLVNDTQCKRAVVANSADREKLKDELKLQESKYVDPKTRVQRNWIIPDLRVNGTLTSSGNTATVTVTITDARTGAVVDGIQKTMTTDQAFEQEGELAKALGERLCKRPAAYTLHLTDRGTGTFGTHDTSGNLDSTLTALRAGGAPGEPPAAWGGVQSTNWTGVTATGKTGGCTLAVDKTDFTWGAQIAVAGDSQIKVDWQSAGAAMATLIITCPVKDQPPFVQPGMPGPSILGISPETATLPLTGGVIPLTGGIANGDGGWSNTGQIEVTPVWANSP